MSYNDLSELGKQVYKFYKLKIYNAKQVQDFADKGKLKQTEVDFILTEENK